MEKKKKYINTLNIERQHEMYQQLTLMVTVNLTLCIFAHQKFSVTNHIDCY